MVEVVPAVAFWNGGIPVEAILLAVCEAEPAVPAVEFWNGGMVVAVTAVLFCVSGMFAVSGTVCCDHCQLPSSFMYGKTHHLSLPLRRSS
jgi:hypothetical protein